MLEHTLICGLSLILSSPITFHLGVAQYYSNEQPQTLTNKPLTNNLEFLNLDGNQNLAYCFIEFALKNWANISPYIFLLSLLFSMSSQKIIDSSYGIISEIIIVT